MSSLRVDSVRTRIVPHPTLGLGWVASASPGPRVFCRLYASSDPEIRLVERRPSGRDDGDSVMVMIDVEGEGLRRIHGPQDVIRTFTVWSAYQTADPGGFVYMPPPRGHRVLRQPPGAPGDEPIHPLARDDVPDRVVTHYNRVRAVMLESCDWPLITETAIPPGPEALEPRAITGTDTAQALEMVLAAPTDSSVTLDQPLPLPFRALRWRPRPDVPAAELCHITLFPLLEFHETAIHVIYMPGPDSSAMRDELLFWCDAERWYWVANPRIEACDPQRLGSNRAQLHATVQLYGGGSPERSMMWVPVFYQWIDGRLIGVSTDLEGIHGVGDDPSATWPLPLPAAGQRFYFDCVRHYGLESPSALWTETLLLTRGIPETTDR